MQSFIDKFKKFNEEQQRLDARGIDSDVLIVDGTNSFIRVFCALQTMDDDGEHIGGIVGFLKSIGMMIRNFKPTRVILVFDGRGGSQRRRSIYPEYKDNRRTKIRLNRAYDFKDIDDESEAMKYQFALLVEILQHLPVTVVAEDNIEADDAIAYLSKYVQEQHGNVMIMSTDKDFLQLVNDQCRVYNPVKKKMYTPAAVVEEFGIHPNNFLLYRIIDGDKSDNVPGVHGVARKGLLKNFPILSEQTPVSLQDIVAYAAQSPDAPLRGRNAQCQKIIDAYHSDEKILDRNHALMQLDDVNISGTAKLRLLNQYQTFTPTFERSVLTTLFAQHKLLSSFTDVNAWCNETWIPLLRHSSKPR